MRKLTIVLALVVAATAVAPATAGAQSSSECSFPVERVDATGTTVTVSDEPQSVVTLNPSAAQTIWEIGAKDKVVGVTKYASNLDGAAAKTNISSGGQTISNEQVVGLNPDLVIAPNTVSNETVRTLRNANLTVYRFQEATSIDDIKRKTRIIGQLVGACAGATETIDWMDTRLSTVDEAVADAERPGAIYTFFGFTAGENTFIYGVIERAGANNVAAETGITGYKQVNDEILVQQNPDWIIRNSDNADVPTSAAYNSTTAIKNGQVVVVNYNQLNRPAPRVVYVISKLAQTFHPDAYAAANATATPTPTATATASDPTATQTAMNGSDGATATPTATPGSSGPGFGMVVALVAILATIGVATQRR